MTDVLRCISPADGSVVVERQRHNLQDVSNALQQASAAQRDWAATPLAQRQQLLSKAVDIFVSQRAEVAAEISQQMGRPLTQAANEVNGVEERSRYMIELAPSALAPHVPPPKPGFTRQIAKEPVGIVAIIAPWNYPFLTAINMVIPALLAGNAVILKHASQTPLCAERLANVFAAAGLPQHVYQYLHLSHADTEVLIADQRIGFVNFTGSVAAGHKVQQAISNHFIVAGLELGGKDPAYVRADANLDLAVETLVDGAFYNSGQSCCGIERIYVDRSIYTSFVDKFAELTRTYRLGDPADPSTNLGPVVNIAAADFVRGQIADALADGATALIDERLFPKSQPGTAYLAPQVLVDVDHSMRVMTEESFGPVVGIMPVDSDEQALALMNDSNLGLTASLWTANEAVAMDLAGKLQTGTVFMNRCDYLDPALAWTGVKDTGRGCSLSIFGFDPVTRLKSYHFRH